MVVQTCGITILGGIIAFLCISVLCWRLLWGISTSILLFAIALWCFSDLLGRWLFDWRLLGGVSRGNLLGGDVAVKDEIVLLGYVEITREVLNWKQILMLISTPIGKICSIYTYVRPSRLKVDWPLQAKLKLNLIALTLAGKSLFDMFHTLRQSTGDKKMFLTM